MTIDDLISNFNMIDDWNDKYSYLIELSREITPFPSEERIEENRIYGCSASVWWKYKIDENSKYSFLFDSDALIVKGLLYILMVIFNQKNISEIQNINVFELFNKMGLSEHLSNQRQVGISSVIAKIQNLGK